MARKNLEGHNALSSGTFTYRFERGDRRRALPRRERHLVREIETRMPAQSVALTIRKFAPICGMKQLGVGFHFGDGREQIIQKTGTRARHGEDAEKPRFE